MTSKHLCLYSLLVTSALCICMYPLSIFVVPLYLHSFFVFYIAQITSRMSMHLVSYQNVLDTYWTAFHIWRPQVWQLFLYISFCRTPISATCHNEHVLVCLYVCLCVFNNSNLGTKVTRITRVTKQFIRKIDRVRWWSFLPNSSHPEWTEDLREKETASWTKTLEMDHHNTT